MRFPLSSFFAISSVLFCASTASAATAFEECVAEAQKKLTACLTSKASGAVKKLNACLARVDSEASTTVPMQVAACYSQFTQDPNVQDCQDEFNRSFNNCIEPADPVLAPIVR